MFTSPSGPGVGPGPEASSRFGSGAPASTWTGGGGFIGMAPPAMASVAFSAASGPVPGTPGSGVSLCSWRFGRPPCEPDGLTVTPVGSSIDLSEMPGPQSVPRFRSTLNLPSSLT